MINKEKQYNIVIEEGVTNIGGGLFVYNFNYLKNYKLASTIKEIEYGAFYGTNIDNLELNEGLEYIGDRAFENATIKNMNIPSTLTSIGAEAFKNSSILSESMEIPTTVQSIGVDAFKSDTEKVNEIRFKEGRESINSEMFSGDIGVKNIKINSDIKNIDCKFYLITSLENININEDNQYYCSKNGVLFNKESSKIIAYPAGKEETTYELPATTKVIGSNSFYNSKIESIDIPNGITEIGDEAFSNSSNLFYISIPSSVTSIGKNIVYGCNLRSANATKGIHVCPDSYPSTIKYRVQGKDSAPIGFAGRLAEHKYGKVTYTWNEDKTECEAERTCIRSDDNIDEEVVQTTSQIITEATCEEAGEKTYTATFNNEAFAEQTATEEIPATGHSWGEITYKWNEDKTECTAERKCTRDETHKETETATISSQITKEATCEEAGEKTYTATFNNEAFAEQTATEKISAKGHTAGQAVEENRVEATCTEDGHYEEVIYCTICHKEISRETKTIKATGHKYSEEWTIDKEATCEEKGEKSHHCTVCGDRKDITEIEATGHSWGEWTITKEPTFTEEGIKTRICANDETHKETEPIAKLNAEKLLTKHEAKEATCEEAGNSEYYSYKNGETEKYYSDAEGTNEIAENSWVIEALGHAYGESTYTWNEDKTECTAERICTRDASHKETETAKTTNSVTKEATCEEVGERTYTATFTNEAFAEQTTTEEIKATGHTAGESVEKNRVEATCTQEGHYDEVIYCTVCNKEINRVQKTIKAKGHTYSTEWTIDKEATCEETGEKSHHCTECGERADITTIEALGHDYQIKSTTEAVCEKGGTIIYECTRCKATKQETIPATGHREEIDAAVEPTCTEKGKTEGKHCSVCGKVLVAQKEIPVLGHTAGQKVEENRVESTCTQEGHYDEVIYCTACNKEITRETKTIKAKGHTYSTEWTIDKEATCEETGEKSHHCTECGERADITTIEALGHNYQIKNTTEAVCEKGGTIIYECTRCKATKQETIPATGHREEIDAAVEPTCTEKGKTEGKHCSVCGKVLVAQKEIPVLGHTAGQKVEENRVESTCTQEGHYDEVIYCTACNKEITRETKTIKAKGHTYSTEWTIDKEATCEETGEKSHHCTECGERADITTIEALGHNYQIKNTTEAVCEKGGTIIYECTRCKTTKEETTPALGHDYEEKIIEPTETEQGYTLHTCKRCGKEYKDNFVPAKKAPIQIKDGIKDIEIIEKDDQKYIIVTPNTSTEDLKEKIDSDNKYDINDKDNNNKNGNLSTGDKLIVDDDKNTNYKIIVKGDVNGDGKIDFMGDVVLLNNYRIGLIKLSTEALLAGDINQDGKIDFVEDVVKINNYRINAIKSINK